MKLLALMAITLASIPGPFLVVPNQNNQRLSQFQVNKYNLIKPDTWERFLTNVANVYSVDTGKKVHIDKTEKNLIKSIDNIADIYKNVVNSQFGELIPGEVGKEIRNVEHILSSPKASYNESDKPRYFGEHSRSLALSYGKTWGNYNEFSHTHKFKLELKFSAVKLGYEGEISIKEGKKFEESTSRTETETIRINGRESELIIQPKRYGVSTIDVKKISTIERHNIKYKISPMLGQYANLYFKRSGFSGTYIARVDISDAVLKMKNDRPEFFTENSRDLFIWNPRNNVMHLSLPVVSDLYQEVWISRFKGDSLTPY